MTDRLVSTASPDCAEQKVNVMIGMTRNEG